MPRKAHRREILARQRGLAVFRGVGIRRPDLSAQDLSSLAESLPFPKFHSRGPWCELDRMDQAKQHE